MNDSLHISEAGLKLIKRFEGLYLHAYYDSVHVLTIGYGHTNLDGISPHVVPGLKITEEQAEEILARSLAVHYEPSVKRLVRVPLSQHEFDALVSFCYNCGEGNLARLVRYLNKGDYGSMPKMLARYNRAGGKVLKGLTRRRAAEAALWNSEPYQHIVAAHVDAVADQEVEFTPGQVAPVIAASASSVDAPEELPDKLAKWGAATSPFTMALGYFTDWRVLAVLCTAALVAGIAYMLWREQTKPVN